MTVCQRGMGVSYKTGTTLGLQKDHSNSLEASCPKSILFLSIYIRVLSLLILLYFEFGSPSCNINVSGAWYNFFGCSHVSWNSHINTVGWCQPQCQLGSGISQTILKISLPPPEVSPQGVSNSNSPSLARQIFSLSVSSFSLISLYSCPFQICEGYKCYYLVVDMPSSSIFWYKLDPI